MCEEQLELLASKEVWEVVPGTQDVVKTFSNNEGNTFASSLWVEVEVI